MEDYDKGVVLGEGTFGSVVRAVHKKTGEVFAIKKIRLGHAKEGVNMTALREVKLLKELQSARIVKLVDVFAHKQNLALVFEFMESDLEMVIKNRATIMSAGDVKAYVRMVLEALDFCHERWVVHRDVKPNNFLIAASGEMKLADFGLARIYGSPDRKYTNQVFARWYRPPELLFGSTLYGPGIDIWAAGCVFAELLLRRPWMPGGSDIEQLSLIFQALGTPSQEAWPGAQSLPHYVEFQRTPAPPLKSIFPKAGDDALDLLSRMMAFDPNRRISVAEALQHRYFKAAPEATHPSRLPKPPIRAHNPLHHQPVGGSALQAAPQEVVTKENVPSSNAQGKEEGTEDGRQNEMGNGSEATDSRNGRERNELRPQADSEDLRYLRKRKLDMEFQAT